MKDRQRSDITPPSGTEALELESGINAEADEKIRAIEAATEAFVTKRMKDARKQAETILSEAQSAAQARVALLVTTTESRLAVERTRQSLLAEEQLMQRILTLTAMKFLEYCASGDHHIRLLTWLCEAAAGLATEKTEVRATEEDMDYLTTDLLREAEGRLKELIGRTVSLRLSKEPPLPGRGLFLSTEGGRIVYDNTARARIARAERTVRTFIRESLESSSQARQGLGQNLGVHESGASGRAGEA